ncbi:universal stress protein [Limibaculum sp. M0105]|uniref:Universal stress protein n=1 Tax=Thermohalobaculum xanthum TaxID=2753746 RepID=A0A8J7M7B6_9RHOB|nr:universal stress protein [Thermohalobaculum xanthum]MBK0399621.1 universal stress protein [Thermohalobaculum xanthum]
MYNRIMVPVDLAHANRLEKALITAADLSKHYKIPVVYVGVTTATPSSLAHNPKEYAEKLAEFGRDQATRHGHQAETKAYTSHDPSIDLDDTLLKAVHETRSDLVVMASHIPNVTDWIWPSNGGTLATHSDASVLVVR